MKLSLSFSCYNAALVGATWMSLPGDASAACCGSFDSAGNPYTKYVGTVCDTSGYSVYSSSGFVWTDEGNSCGDTAPTTPYALEDGGFKVNIPSTAACEDNAATATIKLITGSDYEVKLEFVHPLTDDCSGTFTTDCSGVCTPAPPDSSDDPPPPSCFPESATVIIQEKGSTAMKDLQVGDWVLTGHSTNANGEAIPSYQPVYAFGHRKQEATTDFLQIHTTNLSVPLEVTPEHLVFLKGKRNPVRSDSILVGDDLEASSGKTTAGTVTQINQVRKNGLYTPLTSDGRLIVDGVMVSSYISLQDTAVEDVELFNGNIPGWMLSQHQYVHVSLAPFRLVCMGLLPFSPLRCDSYDDNGMPHYVAAGLKMHKWAEGQHRVAHALFVGLTVLVTGSCFLLEMVCGGPAMGPLVGLVLGATYWRWSLENHHYCLLPWASQESMIE